MRTSIILALVAVSFTAALATSSVPNHAVQDYSGLIKNIKTILRQVYTLPEFRGLKDQIEDLLYLIDTLTGLDFPAIRAQLVMFFRNIYRILNGSAGKLSTVADTVTPVVEQSKSSIAETVARVYKIIQPLLNVLRPIIRSIKANGVPSLGLLDELHRLGVTDEDLTGLVKYAAIQLEDIAERWDLPSRDLIWDLVFIYVGWAVLKRIFESRITFVIIALIYIGMYKQSLTTDHFRAK